MKDFSQYLLKLAFIVFCGFSVGSQQVLAQQKSKQSCSATLIIAPPHISDSLRADALAEVIGAELIERFRSICSQTHVVPQDQSRPLFDKIGITAHFAIRPERIYEEQIEYLTVELGATHFVAVAIDNDSDLIHVEVRAIDETHTFGKSVLKFDLPYAKTVNPLVQTSKWVRLLAPLSGNAVTIGAVDTHLDMTMSDGYEKISDHTRGVLPPLISSVSLSKIDHFRSFRGYDYAGSIFPSTFFFGVDQDTDIERLDIPAPSPARYSTIHVEAYGGCTTILLEGSLHSPIGTTYGGFGFGPCIVQKRQEQRQPILYGTTAFRMEYGHRAFFSESWFFYLNFDTVGFSSTAIYKSDVAHTNSVTRSGVGIGYFIADKEHLFSSFWR